MYYQCCVVSCESRRKDVQLYRFPKSETGLQKWLHFINCERLASLNVEKLKKQHVCHKHFEKKFIASTLMRARLRVGAYPTLFSQSEINSGIPQTIQCDHTENLQVLDYSTKRQHSDHTYCKIRTVEKYFRFDSAPDNNPVTELLDQPATDVFHDLGTDFHDSVDELEYRTNGTQLNDATLIEPCSVPDTQSNTENEEGIIPNTKSFSWQKRSEVVPIPADDIEIDDTLSMYCDDEDPTPRFQDHQDTSAKGDPIVHEEFRCNVCGTEISGFRYTCVQCSDFDLCGACETNREHRQHYMLRVPTPKPAAEVQAVLATVRRYLMKTLDPINELEKDWDDAISVKSEVKSEKEDCDDEDDKPQNKSLDMDTSDSSGTPSSSEHADSDDDVSESPAAECVGQTDTHTIHTTTADQVMVPAPWNQKIENDPLGQKIANQPPRKPDKKKIIMKLTDYLKIKEDNLLAKNIRLRLSNTKPGVKLADVSQNKNKNAHSRIKDASVQSPIKLIQVPTAIKQTNIIAKFEDAGKHSPIEEIVLPIKNNEQIKVIGMQSQTVKSSQDAQSQMKLVGLPPKIHQKDVQIKSKHTSMQPQIIKEVILRPKDPNTQSQIKKVFRTKVKDAGTKRHIKGFRQLDEAVPGYEHTEFGDYIKVLGMETDTSTNNGHKQHAANTDSPHSTNTSPAQSTPSTTHNKIVIQVPDFASPAKKVCLMPTSRVSPKQVDFSNKQHITAGSVKLSTLAKPVIHIGQKWSVQTRLPSNAARNKNGEDNR